MAGQRQDPPPPQCILGRLPIHPGHQGPPQSKLRCGGVIPTPTPAQASSLPPAFSNTPLKLRAGEGRDWTALPACSLAPADPVGGNDFHSCEAGVGENPSMVTSLPCGVFTAPQPDGLHPVLYPLEAEVGDTLSKFSPHPHLSARGHRPPSIACPPPPPLGTPTSPPLQPHPGGARPAGPPLGSCHAMGPSALQ